MDLNDRHNEARGIFNQMRDDYLGALLAGIDDDKVYEALVDSMTNHRAAGNLPDTLLIPLMGFAVRRTAIKRLEGVHAELHPVPMQTPN